MEKQKKWYVVYTRPRWEKRIAKDLETAGIEFYCPLNKVEKQWSDRKKIVLEPLFKGYVFLRLENPSMKDLTHFPGILNFVHWLGKPAVVYNKDILLIRKFLNEFEEATLINDILQPNDLVAITTGLLMDYRGMVLEKRGKYVVVLIQSLGAQLKAKFERKHLRKINPNK